MEMGKAAVESLKQLAHVNGLSVHVSLPVKALPGLQLQATGFAVR